MAELQELILIQGDDPTVTLKVTRKGPPDPDTGIRPKLPVDLTSKRVEVLVKTEQHVGDDTAMYVLSSVGATPRGIVITDPTEGIAIADFTDRIPDAGTFWYRAYISDPAASDLNRQTFSYGPLQVTAA